MEGETRKMTTDVEKQDVTTVFWTNVEWHLENKGWTWRSAFGYQGSIYKQKQSNISLAKVQEVATKLGIDDYAILFEEIPENSEVSK